jgi:hypothetical protein
MAPATRRRRPARADGCSCGAPGRGVAAAARWPAACGPSVRGGAGITGRGCGFAGALGSSDPPGVASTGAGYRITATGAEAGRGVAGGASGAPSFVEGDRYGVAPGAANAVRAATGAPAASGARRDAAAIGGGACKRDARRSSGRPAGEAADDGGGAAVCGGGAERRPGVAIPPAGEAVGAEAARGAAECARAADKGARSGVASAAGVEGGPGAADVVGASDRIELARLGKSPPPSDEGVACGRASAAAPVSALVVCPLRSGGGPGSRGVVSAVGRSAVGASTAA